MCKRLNTTFAFSLQNNCHVTFAVYFVSYGFQSAEAFEFVKKDLSEFSTTVQTDSQKAISNVKENINVSHRCLCRINVMLFVVNLNVFDTVKQ